ncbi:MAG: methyltransferase domain-containing protein [Candidatus Dormibacteraeota bacterium]|nr:methyltransferase domain-containing protein [Candidatus Dormibacteraeota bacterium]
MTFGAMEVSLTMPSETATKLNGSLPYKHVVRPLAKWTSRRLRAPALSGPAAASLPDRNNLAAVTLPAARDLDDPGRQILNKIAEIDWYHSIDLGHGVTTPGFVDHREQIAAYRMPDSLTGMRCLDVATWDGFWAFEMERRGASEVVALDLARLADSDIPTLFHDYALSVGAGKELGRGFNTASEILGSKVRREICSVYDLTPERFGKFDFIFLSDLLLHLRDPQLALQRVFSVCKGSVLVADVYNPLVEAVGDRSLTQFTGWVADQMWWLPNINTLKRMMAVAGFEQIEERSRLLLKARKPEQIHKIVLSGQVAANVRKTQPLSQHKGMAESARPIIIPNLARKRRITIGSIEVVVSLPDALATRISRSTIYAKAARPVGQFAFRLLRSGRASRPTMSVPTYGNGTIASMPPRPTDIDPIARNTIEKIVDIDWAESINLGHGVITPGRADRRPEVEHYHLPESLDGLRCLVAPARDGFWAFELERRGAAEVVALEDPQKLSAARSFETARDILGSKARIEKSDVYGLSPQVLGKFDLVIVDGSLSTLRDPQLALERLRSVSTGQILVVDAYNPFLETYGEICLAEFTGSNKSDQWWSPNTNTLKLMMTIAGYDPVSEVERFTIASTQGPAYRVVLSGRVPERHPWVSLYQPVTAAPAPKQFVAAARES